MPVLVVPAEDAKLRSTSLMTSSLGLLYFPVVAKPALLLSSCSLSSSSLAMYSGKS